MAPPAATGLGYVEQEFKEEISPTRPSPLDDAGDLKAKTRSGLATPATAPVTEPTTPVPILGADGEEVVPGMRRKRSVSERAKKATWRCAHMLKPCAQILLGLLVATIIFYFINDIEGIRTIDVSVISLPFGEVRGKIAADYQEYLGVPFALPPKRFGAPRLWEGAYPGGFLDATVPAPPCAQIVGNRVFGSEDCLRLNVFVPTPSASLPHDDQPAAAGGADDHRRHLRGPARRFLSGGSEEGGQELVVPPRPVMVYLHGGDFAVGSADEVDGRRLAQSNNVILVSVPYRVGALGFLAHPDMLKEEDGGAGAGMQAHEGIGNLGLLDQRAALLWIQQHIHAFNGDPNRVTVFGHGAGATSACLQAILPSQAEGGENQPSRLLTQAAIVESGACYAQPLDMALKRGEEFAAAANCSTLACLEVLPLPDLLKASRDVSAARFRFWQPVVDGRVVPLPANQLLARAPPELALIVGDNADVNDNVAGSALQHAHEADADYVAYVKGPMRALEGLERLTDAQVEELLTLYPPAGSRAAGLAAAEAAGQHHHYSTQQPQQRPVPEAGPATPAVKAAAAALEEQAEAQVVEEGKGTAVGADGQQQQQQQQRRLTGNRLNIAQIMSDAHYFCPGLAAARALPDQSKAYVYSFAYSPPPCRGRSRGGGRVPPTYKGGDRGSWVESFGSGSPAAYDATGVEVPFVFHDRVRGDCWRSFTEAEDLLADEIEGYWTNFARQRPATPNAAPAAAASAPPVPPHRRLGGLGELLTRHRGKEAKAAEAEAEEGEYHRTSEGGAAAVHESLTHWPALAEGGKLLVFEDDGSVATRIPDRQALCAFWDSTQMYTD